MTEWCTKRSIAAAVVIASLNIRSRRTISSPDGRELARLEVGGQDREVEGTLIIDVPVPTARSAAERTPYIWLQPWLLGCGALAPLLGLFCLGWRRRQWVREGAGQWR